MRKVVLWSNQSHMSFLFYYIIIYIYILTLLLFISLKWQMVCQYLKNPHVSDTQLVKNIFKALNVYYNYSGQARCLNTSETTSSRLGSQGWSYQVCIISPSGTYFSLMWLCCNREFTRFCYLIWISMWSLKPWINLLIHSFMYVIITKYILSTCHDPGTLLDSKIQR